MNTSCKGYYDLQQKKYIEFNNLQKFNCCDKNCEEYLTYCNSICENDEECNNCQIWFESCLDNCKSQPFWFDENPYNKCIDNSVCFNNFNIDTKCIKEIKFDIRNCCLTECRENNSNNLNCEEVCDFMYSYITKDKKNKKVRTENKNQENKEINYIPWIFFIAFVIFLILFVLKMNINNINENKIK